MGTFSSPRHRRHNQHKDIPGLKSDDHILMYVITSTKGGTLVHFDHNQATSKAQ